MTDELDYDQLHQDMAEWIREEAEQMRREMIGLEEQNRRNVG